MANKKVAIVYNQSLTQVQGINYVNSSFVEGQSYFNENNLELSCIFAPDGVFEAKGKNRLDLIGSNRDSIAYIKKRKLRTFLRELLSSNYLLGASVKIYFNHFRNAQKAVERFLQRSNDFDYVIFQDLFSARYFLNHQSKDKKAKTILILHCGIHELEQFKPEFKGVFKHKWIGDKLEKCLHQTLYGVDKVIYLSKHACGASPIENCSKTYIYNGKEDIPSPIVYPVSSSLNIVIVASVIYHKGQHLLLKALTILPEEIKNKIHLFVVGSGSELPVCQQFAKENKLDDVVTFMGNRNDVPEILKKMDVFILPSLSEGMPMSIIEAMRQGMYVVATKVGGIPEMITPTFGEFIDREESSIVKAIQSIVENNKVTIESKIASRKYYEANFTLRRMIEAYSKVLNSL